MCITQHTTTLLSISLDTSGERDVLHIWEWLQSLLRRDIGSRMTNREIITAFHKANERIEEGAEIVLPDTGQRFVVVGHSYWRKSGSRFVRVGLVWQAPCAVCGELFESDTHLRFKWLTRTCEIHRGQWRSPAFKAAKKVRDSDSRRTPVIDAISATLSAFDLLGRKPSWEELVAGAVDMLPKGLGKRDTRRQRVVRSVRYLEQQEPSFACRVSRS